MLLSQSCADVVVVAVVHHLLLWVWQTTCAPTLTSPFTARTHYVELGGPLVCDARATVGVGVAGSTVAWPHCCGSWGGWWTSGTGAEM